MRAENKEKLKNRISQQFKLLTFNIDRFSVLHYLYNEYKHNNPVIINDDFWASVMHVFYERIIIDLSKLFSERKNNDNFSFPRTLSFVKSNGLINLEKIQSIEYIINSCETQTSNILKIRDKELAHSDFSENSIKVNLEYFSDIIKLIDCSKKIISHYGEGLHDFDNEYILPSLKDVIVKLNKNQTNEPN